MNKALPISWIEVVNFGPFAAPAKLHLDPHVTVLTGANDAGKSSLLAALHYTFSDKKAAEGEVNQERREKFAGKWNDDPDVYCNFGLSVSQDGINRQLIGGALQPGDEVVFFRRLNKGEGFNHRHVQRGNSRPGIGVNLPKPPQAILLTAGEVRNLLPLSELNENELKLLRLGFGDAFPRNLEGTASERNTRIGKAQESLNRMMREILPPAIRLEFRVNDISGNGKELNLTLVDPLNGYVPFGSRGAGIRKLMSLMGSLLALKDAGSPVLLLIDEPENSLHADAQHSLRRLLERLADLPLIQVVYATHSPSMVNTMRAGSIRLLRRTTTDEKPTTEILNQAFNDNFLTVRSSLGITPADSLLYAPVTVIVEGPSEVRSLPVMFKRLHDAGIAGFEDVEAVLSQIHFLDGTGDSYEYMCRLAKSQNAKPVVFLDGDKPMAVQKLKEQHPDVPLVLLETNQEFENLVPEEAYIGAVQAILLDKSGKITQAGFQQWVSTKNPKPTWMFSKRVERWLDDEFDLPLYKPLVMERAATDTPVEKVNAAPLRELLKVLRELLK